MSTPRNRIVYFVKRPRPGRVTFSITERTTHPSGRRDHVTIDSDALTKINSLFKTGLLTRHQADVQVAALCAQLNDEERRRHESVSATSTSNMALLDDYWKTRYAARKIVDHGSARNRLARAVRAVGHHPLLGPAEPLQKQLDDGLSAAPRKHRAVVGVINQIRRSFKIAEPLHTFPEQSPEFRYLTEREFLAMVKHLDGWKATMARVLFGTGVRFGEACAIGPGHFRRHVLNVATQCDRADKVRDTKTRKQRKTYVLPLARAALAELAAMKLKRNQIEREFRESLQAACTKAFPDEPTKWLTTHDLRHSYAVFMLTERGANISTIAKLLGNSVTVCERYYLNFVFEDDVLAALDRA